ncbi:MAG: methylmalonyl-CoA epimerase [Planctomycetia bacterium TMED53]|nr:MAG: methylmalonyl-CoA epimerase [Planctomycetia bacterium TMED53]
MLQSLTIDHVGIAVKSIDDSLKFWATGLGAETSHREEVASQKVIVAFLDTGQGKTELLEPTSPDSPIARFIDKKGEGIHHIAYRTPNLASTMSRLIEDGARLIYDKPQPGSHGTQINFVHPASAGGVLVELVEYPTREELS